MRVTLGSGFLNAIFLLSGVTAAFGQTPVVDPVRGTVNSASFVTGQPVAPGSMVAIFGTNLATATMTADTIPYGNTVGNTSVMFGNVAAAISGVFHDPNNPSNDEVIAQVPWEILPMLPSGTAGPVAVTVVVNGTSSTPQNVTVAPTAPGIFAFALVGGQVVGLGSGQAIAYTSDDGALAAATGSILGLNTHPVKLSDPNLTILASGLGAVDATVNDGDIPTVPTSNALTVPTVMVGGVPAVVTFAGLVGRDANGNALGYVGVYQINVTLDPSTPTGNAVPVQISMNGFTTAPNVTVAVGQ